MGTMAGVESDINKVIGQLSNPQNTLDDTLRGLVDAGSFAWFSYGMMAITNLVYYTDKLYWYFIIRDDVRIRAFKTWWGISEFGRVAGNFSLWLVGFLFWAGTFLPIHFFALFFSYVASFILLCNLIRLFGSLTLKVLAYFLDDYAKDYKYYAYKIEFGGEATVTAIDYSLELSTFIGQMIGYPLLQYSTRQLERYRGGEDLMFDKLMGSELPDPPAEEATIF